MSFSLVYKGFNYVADVDGSYADANSLPALVSTGANSVALTEDYGINVDTSSVYGEYAPIDGNSVGYTDTLADLATTITAAESDGLSVMVRPLIDFEDPAVIGSYSTAAEGGWRATYVPTDPAAFFASYKTMILQQAAVAEANGAQLLCIGTELDQLTGPTYYSYWADIISAVRTADPSLKLTYSAIWDDDISPWQSGAPAGTGDLTTQVSFWNLLDYVGIDMYAPISDATNPTLAQLIDGWTQVPTDPTSLAVTGNQSLIQYFEGVQAAIGKPLLFTELGYNSAPDAASQPFFTSSSVYDPTLQANLYTAFFDAWQAAGNSALNGVYFWNWEPDPATVGAGTNPSWTPQGSAGTLEAVTAGFAACFAAGTRIATPRGERAVEMLRVGDLVLTADGSAKPVRWVGHRHVDCAAHPQAERVLPVRVQAHAFGAGQPHRDLWLSPDHAAFIDGVLIPVRYLVNGATILQEETDAVIYWHVELERHDVLLAEGLACESYLDTGNRSAFANGGACVQLHPDFALGIWQAQGCAPLVLAGASLTAARSHLLARAETLGHATTRDPALYALAAGRVVHPEIFGRTYRFRLPGGATAVRLVSRSTTPCEIRDNSSDHRRLGVAVCRLAIDRRPIGLTDARLRTGWHATETEPDTPPWRWTDGDATLVLQGGEMLEIELAMTHRYWAAAGHGSGRVAGRQRQRVRARRTPD